MGQGGSALGYLKKKVKHKCAPIEMERKDPGGN